MLSKFWCPVQSLHVSTGTSNGSQAVHDPAPAPAAGWLPPSLRAHSRVWSSRPLPASAVTGWPETHERMTRKMWKSEVMKYSWHHCRDVCAWCGHGSWNKVNVINSAWETTYTWKCRPIIVETRHYGAHHKCQVMKCICKFENGNSGNNLDMKNSNNKNHAKRGRKAWGTTGCIATNMGLQLALQFIPVDSPMVDETMRNSQTSSTRTLGISSVQLSTNKNRGVFKSRYFVVSWKLPCFCWSKPHCWLHIPPSIIVLDKLYEFTNLKQGYR